VNCYNKIIKITKQENIDEIIEVFSKIKDITAVIRVSEI